MVGAIELLLELFLEVILEKRIIPFQAICARELIELVELNKGHPKLVEPVLECVLLPLLELDLHLFLKELKQIVVRQFVLLATEKVSELFLEFLFFRQFLLYLIT